MLSALGLFIPESRIQAVKGCLFRLSPSTLSSSQRHSILTPESPLTPQSLWVPTWKSWFSKAMTCRSSVCCWKPFSKSDSNTHNQRQKNPKLYVKHESRLYQPPFFCAFVTRGAREHSPREHSPREHSLLPQVYFTGISNFRRALRGHLDQIYFKAQMSFKMSRMGLFFSFSRRLRLPLVQP